MGEGRDARGVRPSLIWRCGSTTFDLSSDLSSDLSGGRVLVMGIVNVTPDSFSDGGRHSDPGAALEHAAHLVEQGADIIDVGAESTRPGAEAVDERTELGRLEPVLERIVALPVAVSVDTTKPAVMTMALDAGVQILNDVNAFRADGALEVAAASDCGLVVMHMMRDPATMQDAPRYDDVFAEVQSFLAARVAELVTAGVHRDRIAVDPGVGFGKSVAHNLELIGRAGELADRPVLIGASRKRFLGAITGRNVNDRTAASTAAAMVAVSRGARIVRVHDVAATVDALAVLAAFGPPATAV
jgi:dihydropteroate synthase